MSCTRNVYQSGKNKQPFNRTATTAKGRVYMRTAALSHLLLGDVCNIQKRCADVRMAQFLPGSF